LKFDTALNVKGFTLYSKITRLIEDYIYFVQENILECSVLHEAEYIEEKISVSLKNILVKKLLNAGLEISDEFFWFFWGSVRFLAIWSVLWKLKKIDETVFENLLAFLFNGISPAQYELNSKVFFYKPIKIQMLNDSTKMKLLSSAEHLFGNKGYHKTQISEITKSAGVAQGTFYLYFQNKKEILKELVEWTNRNLRKELKEVIKNLSDRRDMEIAGYFVFLKFFEKHPWMYRIVREAEFVVPDVGVWYYRKLHDSYLEPLKQAISKNQIVDLNPDDLAVFLMGIGHFMGEDLIVLKKYPEDKFKDSLSKLSKYLFSGIRGGK
jgi:AcrR family transcriptional regulator